MRVRFPPFALEASVLVGARGLIAIFLRTVEFKASRTLLGCHQLGCENSYGLERHSGWGWENWEQKPRRGEGHHSDRPLAHNLVMKCLVHSRPRKWHLGRCTPPPILLIIHGPVQSIFCDRLNLSHVREQFCSKPLPARFLNIHRDICAEGFWPFIYGCYPFLMWGKFQLPWDPLVLKHQLRYLYKPMWT